jgi:hypothetical protein
MPDRARVEAFVAAVVGGDHVAAIADFYHEDASMQENLQEPRRGRALLMEQEAKALARVAAVYTHPDPVVLIDGDRVVVNWTFDFTGKDGVTRRLNELALQTWRGDRVQEERFVYDTATAWQVVEGTGGA